MQKKYTRLEIVCTSLLNFWLVTFFRGSETVIFSVRVGGVAWGREAGDGLALQDFLDLAFPDDEYVPSKRFQGRIVEHLVHLITNWMVI